VQPQRADRDVGLVLDDDIDIKVAFAIADCLFRCAA
jgi:hypothetical protein